ncbi:hypothetical protein BABINDRAFT_124033 [Babjeviella inositovora NRRL Y-12698]|uniref:Uncharacterized protein n=1 Tax=Babjeviella inositovora NRRL Y-12698 TaxID=984486 RepID=A0A1E3QUN5_9ASCO|nr:uncharacterized protein BABINDRAFT_124033 [Babjeviella inositovora NRRL Y-12698]ODQ81396.1 hypothetical protein BABINDRAFT_124033 [Babjeviella inositovora NRRL Y-12698]
MADYLCVRANPGGAYTRLRLEKTLKSGIEPSKQPYESNLYKVARLISLGIFGSSFLFLFPGTCADPSRELA